MEMIGNLKKRLEEFGTNLEEEEKISKKFKTAQTDERERSLHEYVENGNSNDDY
jgi:hypothetical protein